MKFRPKQCPECLWNEGDHCSEARLDNNRFVGESEMYCYAYEPDGVQRATEKD